MVFVLFLALIICQEWGGEGGRELLLREHLLLHLQIRCEQLSGIRVHR